MQQPFASPGEALEHYGVKGMRWGVHKEEETSSEDSSSTEKVVSDAKAKAKAANNAKTKAYMAAANSVTTTPQQAVKNVRRDRENFAKKFESADGDGKGLTPTQKKLLIGGAVGITAIGGVYLAKKYGLGTTSEIPKFRPGDKVSLEEFIQLRQQSQFAALMGHSQYITDASFQRSAFELPAGHTFHRLSYDPEATFGKSTYALHSIEDFHRYVASGFMGIHELDMAKMQHVTWKSTKAIKVPELTEVLDTVRDVLAEERKVGKSAISDRDVIDSYSKWSGGGWGEGNGYGGGRNLLNSLKAKGYSAIVDEGDGGILGESPLLMFDTSGMGPKTSTFVGREAVKTAQQSLTEIANRKT